MHSGIAGKKWNSSYAISLRAYSLGIKNKSNSQTVLPPFNAVIDLVPRSYLENGVGGFVS